MNFKTLTLSVLIIWLIFTASGIKQGRNLVSVRATDEATCGKCIIGDQVYCYYVDTFSLRAEHFCCDAQDVTDVSPPLRQLREETIKCYTQMYDCQSESGVYDTQIEALETCPSPNKSIWGIETKRLAKDGTHTFSPDSTLDSEGNHCIYEITTSETSTDDSLSVQFTVTSLSNAALTIYKKKSDDTYEKVGDVSQDDSLDVTIHTDNFKGYYAVLMATADNANGKITAKVFDPSESLGKIVGPGIYSLLLVVTLMQIF